MTQVNIVDLEKLRAIGRAVQRAKGSLPSVRRDSAQWQAWRGWFRERGLMMEWSDRQPPDSIATITLDFPPADLDAAHDHWVKGKKSELDE